VRKRISSAASSGRVLVAATPRLWPPRAATPGRRATPKRVSGEEGSRAASRRLYAYGQLRIRTLAPWVNWARETDSSASREAGLR
jgi:hypothetical protein